MRSPLTAVFACVADTRALLEELLIHDSVPGEDAVAEIHRCRAALEGCLAWKGSNDRERSVRRATENSLQSCLDALRMAEMGLYRGRRDMVETASQNLAYAHERMLGIARVLQQ